MIHARLSSSKSKVSIVTHFRHRTGLTYSKLGRMKEETRSWRCGEEFKCVDAVKAVPQLSRFTRHVREDMHVILYERLQ